jgi:hypothetical protein
MYLLSSRTNYSVISSDNYDPNTFFNYTNPEVALYMTNMLGEYLPDADRLYSIVGTYWYYTKFQQPDGTLISSMSSKILKMEKCNAARHFPNNFEMWKNEKFLNDSYCVAPNQIANISKPFAYDDSTAIVYWIQKCQNTTTKNDCHSKEYIDKTLENVFLLTRYTNYYFEHSKQTGEAVQYVQTDGFSISSTINKSFWYTLKSVEYFTDSGIFLPETTLQNFYTYFGWKESVILSKDTTIPDSVAALYFNMNPLKLVITKKYYKFQNMLADVGGLLKSVIWIATLISQYLTRPTLVDLFNNIYKYEAYNSNENLENQPLKNFVQSENNSMVKSGFMQPSMLTLKTSKIKTSDPVNDINNSKIKPDFISNNEKNSLIILLENKNKNSYYNNLSNFKKLFRCILSTKKDIQIKQFKLIEAKLEKIVSFEHLIKITKNVKFFKNLFLNEYQNKVIKICQVPKKKESSQVITTEKISEGLLNGINKEKLENTTDITGIDSKLLEILLR